MPEREREEQREGCGLRAAAGYELLSHIYRICVCVWTAFGNYLLCKFNCQIMILLSAAWSILYLYLYLCIFVYPRVSCAALSAYQYFIYDSCCLFVFNSHNLLSVFTLACLLYLLLSLLLSLSLLCSLSASSCFLWRLLWWINFQLLKTVTQLLIKVSPASYYLTLSLTSPAFFPLLVLLFTLPLPLLTCWHRQQSNFN